jgi:hypothetical protein
MCASVIQAKVKLSAALAAVTSTRLKGIGTTLAAASAAEPLRKLRRLALIIIISLLLLM